MKVSGELRLYMDFDILTWGMEINDENFAIISVQASEICDELRVPDIIFMPWSNYILWLYKCSVGMKQETYNPKIM